MFHLILKPSSLFTTSTIYTSIGTSIRNSKNDILKAISLPELQAMLLNDTQPLALLTKQIKELKKLNNTTYQEAKKQLPYICLSDFRDGVRHSDNFVQANGWVIDIDNIGTTTNDLQLLRENIQKDPFLAMSYISPSGNGLKLLYFFETPIQDTKRFTLLYKAFIEQITNQYNLDTSRVDSKTNDATRVSFICTDKDVYYNPNFRLLVPILPIVNTTTTPTPAPPPYATDTKDTTDEYTFVEDISIPFTAAKNTQQEETYQQILNTLHPNSKPLRTTQAIIIPPILNEILQNVTDAIQYHAFELHSIKDIQYGKQITCKNRIHTAEVNIFYGKRGFSVIKSVKTTTHASMNAALHAIVTDCIYQLQ